MAPSSHTPAVVLVALDDQASRRVRAAMAHTGWALEAAPRIGEAEHAIAVQHPRALVLVASDGTIDVLRRLSRQYPTVALLVWGSALSSEMVAQLLLAGAADVLGYRMSDAELHARTARAIGSAAGERLDAAQMGDLAVDSFRGETTWRGELVPLTNRERDVLGVLVQERGRTLRREVLYQRVWGHAMPAGDRNVDVNIKRLRSKLAAATGGLATVETISRVGYRLQLDDGLEGTSEG